MRRTLGVIFVNPTTGEPVDLRLRKSASNKSGPGPNLKGERGLNLNPAPRYNLSGEPGINLETLYTEKDREIILRETSSSSDSLLLEALSQYGVADDDVLERHGYRHEPSARTSLTKNSYISSTQREPSFGGETAEFSSPIGFLLTSVPKCFVGEAFQQSRRAQKKARDREAAERAQREAEFENWRKEQQAILDDPNTSEEDKKWARKMLSPAETSY